MSDFMQKARKLFPTLQSDRRALHSKAEAGMHLPNTTAYLLQRLRAMGLQPVEICDSGLSCLIGGKNRGKTILLRSDTDALPMSEDNDLPFKTTTDAAHTCGHDMHMAMLLGAAAMLKEHENELRGTVKLMFQPGEEGLGGAKAMIEAGILDNPKVDAALALHVMPDALPGAVSYTKGAILASADSFKVTVRGKGTHGSTPHLGVDPINTAVHVYLAFQELIARETPPMATAALTIGKFSAGTINNILPEEAIMLGSLRAYSKEVRDFLVTRMREVAENIGKVYRTSVTLEFPTGVPVTINDPALTEQLVSYIDGMSEKLAKNPNYVATASEDFSYVANLVPTTMFMLGAQTPGSTASLHNPGVMLNEDCMPYGAAILAQCAFEWLKNN